MAQADQIQFRSQLPQGRQRFLAHVLEHALRVGRRSASDFVRHFPPAAIMEGIANQPELRGRILEHTTGLKQKIAIKKSWSSAAEDLSIALAEGETSAQVVVDVFGPDERVRFLDAQKLWSFLVEGEFWLATLAKKEEYTIAKQHLSFMLERALTDGLLTQRDIVDGITVAELAVRLPKAELGKIIQQALTSGHAGTPFTESDLLIAMPPEVMVEYVPLAHLFEQIVIPKIAEAHDYVPRRLAEPTQAQPEPAAQEEEAQASSNAASPGNDGEGEAAQPAQEWAGGEEKGSDWMEFDEDSATVAEDDITDEDFASP
jgi:hypothetical protein